MTAKELRIGNLIDKNNEICEVSSIHSDSTIRIFNNDKTDTFGCFALRIFNPIPLTEEWLVKFGFKKNGDWAEIKIPTRAKIGFFNWNSAECDLVQDGKYYAFKNGHIKYVHQLQNLYFALTGEELVVSDIVNETLQQNTVSCLNCPTCNGDSWMQNSIQSEKKYCKCGAIF
jgi:hypothetical protein